MLFLDNFQFKMTGYNKTFFFIFHDLSEIEILIAKHVRHVEWNWEETVFSTLIRE